MAPRILASTILLSLLVITGCTDKTEGFFAADSVAAPNNPPDTGSPGDGSSIPPIDPDIGGGGSDGEGSGGGEPPQPVPEPATFFLLGTGLTTMALYQRRRRRSAEEQSELQGT